MNIVAQYNSTSYEFEAPDGQFAPHSHTELWPAWTAVVVGFSRTASTLTAPATAASSAPTATTAASGTSSGSATVASTSSLGNAPTTTESKTTTLARAFAEAHQFPFFIISPQNSLDAEVKAVIVTLCERYARNVIRSETLSKQFAADSAKAAAYAEKIHTKKTKATGTGTATGTTIATATKCIIG
jgi:hypothetical protein